MDDEFDEDLMDDESTEDVPTFEVAVGDDDDDASIRLVRVTTTRKRKRILCTQSQKSPTQPKTAPPIGDEDDGATCPVCLDQWEMSGDHRLTSLKCGHLFGHSCIKRWLQECTGGNKCCPSCKTKATMRDFRFLYAKKLCVSDNSETVALRDALDQTKSDLVKLRAEKNMVDFELQHNRGRILRLQNQVDQLNRQLAAGGSAQPGTSASTDNVETIDRLKKIKLFLEKTIDISKDGGCRCMVTARWANLLFMSHKSSQNLFPGYGVRFVDLETMRPASFMHVSAKPIRDLAVTDNSDNEPNFMLASTLESCGRLFDVENKSLIQTYKPDPPRNNGAVEQSLWSCGFDTNNSNLIHYGSHQGNVYVFDRRTSQQLTCLETVDSNPAMNIASIPVIPNILPHGGFLICKLKSVLFYQYTDPSRINFECSTVNIDGPFSSMSYSAQTGYVLITTRSSKVHATSRYLLAEFVKSGEYATLVVKQAFHGSDVMPVSSKPTQFNVYGTKDVLVSAYLQNTKQLVTWALNSYLNNLKIQVLPVADTVLDLCPIYAPNMIHVAALTDQKCRIFKVHEDRV